MMQNVERTFIREILTAMLFLLPFHYLAGQPLTLLAFEYPPIYQNEENPGVACEIALAAFKEADIEAVLSFLPVKRMIASLSAGEAHAAIGGRILFKHELTSGTVAPSNTIMHVLQTFIYDTRRFPEGLNYSSLTELSPYRIGVLNGSGIMEFLKKESALTLIPNTIHEGSARQLYHGWIDLWAIVDLTGLAYIRNLYPAENKSFKAYSLPYEIGDITVFFSAKQDPEGILNASFTEGFKKILSNGTYLKILQSYYGETSSIPEEALAPELILH
ncbi:transporter substrate-binding domain-containing protein [Treponema zuelzerae]|uniref:Transporter substrate-binding domain-containing protein n=1 Tax=Teretinema zuelzerae TaxID=156 RepID=A0AAE3EJC5_9SPIR|nr:transporter substrate-binding domain-containing protein [Teretinema zuelzerae]MCD1654861.1 transporter substrate-binding domain-containing protein [Teretinema zuelzerae]